MAQIRKSFAGNFKGTHYHLSQVKEGTIIRIKLNCDAKKVSFYYDDVLLGTVDMATFLSPFLAIACARVFACAHLSNSNLGAEARDGCVALECCHMTFAQDTSTESEEDLNSSEDLQLEEAEAEEKEKEKETEEMWHPVLLCCGCKDGTDFSLFAV